VRLPAKRPEAFGFACPFLSFFLLGMQKKGEELDQAKRTVKVVLFCTNKIHLCQKPKHSENGCSKNMEGGVLTAARQLNSRKCRLITICRNAKKNFTRIVVKKMCMQKLI
jgi:hypothetical protein